MSEEKENVRTLLYKQFKKGVKAAQAARNINYIFGQDVTNNRTAQRWFKKFSGWHRNIKHKKGAGRPPLVNKQALSQKFGSNNDLSASELSVGIALKVQTGDGSEKVGSESLGYHSSPPA